MTGNETAILEYLSTPSGTALFTVAAWSISTAIAVVTFVLTSRGNRRATRLEHTSASRLETFSALLSSSRKLSNTVDSLQTLLLESGNEAIPLDDRMNTLQATQSMCFHSTVPVLESARIIREKDVKAFTTLWTEAASNLQHRINELNDEVLGLATKADLLSLRPEVRIAVSRLLEAFNQAFAAGPIAGDTDRVKECQVAVANLQDLIAKEYASEFA